jgi:hypothetical protein
MEPLPLRLIGWVFTLVPAIALGIGGLIIYMLFRSGGLARRYAAQGFFNDLALVVTWVAGLAGGIGVLQGKAWSLWVLEFFCWVLCVLVLLSSAYRLVELKNVPDKTPGNWIAAVSGILLLALPILAFCGGTIYTLHTEEARRALSG